MSYPYKDTNPLDIPLGAYQNFDFEDFDNYFQSQLCQTASSLHSPRRSPRHPASTAASPSPSSWDSSASSASFYPNSQSSSLPSISWSSDASSLDSYPIQPSSSSQNSRLSSFATLSDDDYAFFANIDPALLDSNLGNFATDPSIPHIPEPVGLFSPPTRKRPSPPEEPVDQNNASKNASSSHKRRKLSTDNHQTLLDVHPPAITYNNNGSGSNVVPNIVDNFNVAVPRTPTFPMDSMLSQAPYMLHDAPVPFMNNLITPPVTMPPAYVPATQPRAPNVSFGGAIDYPSWSNVNQNANFSTGLRDYNASSWDPISYLSFSNGANGPIDWTTGLPGPDNFYSATALGIPSTTPTSSLVPPSLGQQAPSGVPYYDYRSVADADAFANNATHSGVDFCQHSHTTHEISMTEHTANASMSNTNMPPTSGASSAEPVTTTFKHYIPTPSSPSRSTSSSASHRKQARSKKRRQQLLPAAHLWTRISRDEFVCHYIGPAKPKGCNKVTTTARNLSRHMRTHAAAERDMPIAAEEKVAINGLPEKLHEIEVVCPLSDAQLHQCAHYRRYGERWSDWTMDRRDNALRKHKAANHPPEPKETQKKNKRKSKA